MAQDTFIQIRVSKKEKQASKKIFESLGLTTSGAVKLFLRRTVEMGTIPFSLGSDACPPQRKVEKELEKGQTSGPQWAETSFQKRRIG